MTREEAYLRFLIDQGMVAKFGPMWAIDDPRRPERIEHELEIIEFLKLSSFFIILADILAFCRRENIPYGPGRGSVGGSFVAFAVGVHEMDSIEWDLTFARFLTKNRVGLPDVDIDFSQRRRHEVIDFIQRTYEQKGYKVLQVVALSRMGGRGTIDAVCAAKREVDPYADNTATTLKRFLPEGNITGGTKQARELAWWIEQGHGDRKAFEEVADTAGWLDPLLKIDGMFTNQARHAAGVVILDEDDLANMPLVGAKDSDTGQWNMLTGYDMYDLDALRYMKYDILGLRTLDVLADAHKFVTKEPDVEGNLPGSTGALMKLWRDHRDNPDVYPMLSEGDTLGIFQMETSGYRRTLRDFQPTKFEHIVALNALYRPGALDAKRDDDGKNMVEIFIDRKHGREAPTPPCHQLEDLLSNTYGIFLYQEQSMRATQILAGFDDAQADTLRKAIGKKQQTVMDSLKPQYLAGCTKNGLEPAVADRVWDNIDKAARYSWNLSHSCFYATITWQTAYFKYHHPAAFYAALLNSFEKGSKQAEKQANVIAEARQKVTISPPNINLAQDGFIADGDSIVFGLMGLKGIGPSNRAEVLAERNPIPYGSFSDLCNRLPSLPITMKKTLIQAGAFDQLEDRAYLLSQVEKAGKPKEIECERCHGTGACPLCDGTGCPECQETGECGECEGGIVQKFKTWTVAEHLNHNRNLKVKRPVPEVVSTPSAKDIGEGELKSIGFYVSDDPLADVSKALARCPKGNHWGGEIENIYKRRDKTGKDMATITLMTPGLSKLRVVVFSSVWPQNAWMKKGDRCIVRGTMSGEDVIANAVFPPDMVTHFKRLKVTRNGGEPEVSRFDGSLATVESLEAAGYAVSFL